MNRKQFIELHGASCANWNWSWSFANHDEQFVIFGLWDRYEWKTRSLILSADWRVSARGRQQPGYAQAVEHLQLVRDESYSLYTFPMHYSDSKRGKSGTGPAAIGGFTPTLSKKGLWYVEGDWFAVAEGDHDISPEEVGQSSELFEGAKTEITVNAYERNSEARALCLQHFGYICQACSFNFESFYGALGRNYIHVHHVVPLSELDGSYAVNPRTDLVPLCPNCHAMVHRTEPTLDVAKLKSIIELARNKRASEETKEDIGAAA